MSQPLVWGAGVGEEGQLKELPGEIWSDCLHYHQQKHMVKDRQLEF